MRGDGRTPTKWESAANQRKALDALAGDAEAVGADHSEEDSRPDSAASAGLRHAPRAVPADDRRGLRSAQPGADRRRRHDRLRAAARSRGAHGGAARRRSRRCPASRKSSTGWCKATFDAPTATPYEAEVRRAEERVLVDRADVAGRPPRRTRQVRAIASLKLQRLAARLRANGGQDRRRHRAAHAARRRHQALPRASRRDVAKMLPAAPAPPGRADRRHGPGLAGAAARLLVGRGQPGTVALLPAAVLDPSARLRD